MSHPCFFSGKKTCGLSGANLEQLRWVFRSYKGLQILRFYCSNTGLYTGILHRRFAGAIHRTNFPGRILWRYGYRKFHLVAPGIYTDIGPVGTRWLAITVFCDRHPNSTSTLAFMSASSFLLILLCPLTHISVLGRSRILVNNPSSIQDRGWVYCRLLIRCITP